MRKQADGYILMLSLLIMAIIVLLVTQLSQQASVQHFFSRTVEYREKARVLAWSGIQLAFDQLGVPKEEPKKEEAANQKPNQKAETPNPLLVMLKKILPSLNTQQSFLLKQEVDGVEGQIGFCITVEDGKLDVNKIFDFQKKRFINDDTKKAVQALFAALKSFTQKDLFAPFEKFLKQRTTPLTDVTELLEIKEFQDQFANAVFYIPPPETQESDKREKRTIFLTDIFTINGSNSRLNIWVLSDSIAALLGLQRADTRTSQARKKEVEELIKGIKQVEPKVETMWDQYLKKLYGKDFKTLAKAVNPILQSSLSFRYFTVLSYGTVGAVTQQLAVLIERINDMEFLIKKVYWL